MVDGASLNPALSTSDVSLTTGTDSYGGYVEVKVTYSFKMLSSYLGFSTETLARTVRMRVAPGTPG